MKKSFFAYAMALATITLMLVPALRAEDQITIKDPAEFNAYQFATSQTDAKTKASQLESFLTTYPQSVVKAMALDQLLDTYQSLGDTTKALSTANQLLQVDANNLKAIYISVYIKKSQCGKTQDAQTCDDGAALAKKGLQLTKPEKTSDDDWKKQTSAAFPVFNSAIALDYAIAKKDYKSAIDFYKAELMLYTDDQSKSIGLVDMLQLAQAYTMPGPAKDLVQACWFYARVWNFAPASYKTQISPKLEYYYKKYHGNLDGLDDLKKQAQASTFPPSTLSIVAAKTPAEIIHDLIQSTPDLSTLALADKETILAVGSKEDADKLWTLLKGQMTPVPGDVVESVPSVIKVVVTTAKTAKPTDYYVTLKSPITCATTLPDSADLKAQEDYVTANGVQEDVDKLTAVFSSETDKVTKITLEPAIGVIKMAVTEDAKSEKQADFIVYLKTPLACKEAPAAGFTYGLLSKGETELDGTYDSYKQNAATATTTAAAEIVLKEAFIQAAAKKVTATPSKPAAGKKAGATSTRKSVRK
jgi:hypothetical protein